jgi:hypothetical protein
MEKKTDGIRHIPMYVHERHGRVDVSRSRWSRRMHKAVYYNVCDTVSDAKIKKDFQPLSDAPMLTENDKLIIRNYNDKYLKLMNYCMGMLIGFR